jgi:hypothetical protein
VGGHPGGEHLHAQACQEDIEAGRWTAMLLRFTNKLPLMDRRRMERQVRDTWNGFERARTGPALPLTGSRH